MTATAILELFNLASLLVEKILPIMTKALEGGEIPVAQQQELKGKIEALKAKLTAGELGSHWTTPDRE